MGIISKLIKRNFLLHVNKKTIDINEMRDAKKEAEKSIELLKSFRGNYNSEDSDPLHYAYIAAYGFVCTCMHRMTELREMKDFKKAMVRQEEIYMPSGPPMSPLTDSYYMSWELCDLAVGKEKETLASIFLELAEILKISAEEIDIIQKLSSSRMGIYEVCKKTKGKIILKELLTENEYKCVCPAGYKGKIGQLWYVRLLPPIDNYVDYHVVLTTPYVLLTYTKKEWLSFFERNNVSNKNLFDFMKFGPSISFWHEFVFYGFYNYTDQVIFLSGIADQENTMPCHESFNQEKKMNELAPKSILTEDMKKINANTQDLSWPSALDLDDIELPEILNGKKASETFLEYARPLINDVVNEDATNLQELEDLLRIPWTIWNSCIYENSSISNKPYLNDLKSKLPKDKYFKEMVNFFEKRKKIDFSEFNYLLGDFSLISNGNGEFNLRIESRYS